MRWMQRMIDPFGAVSSFMKICEARLQDPVDLAGLLMRLHLDLQTASIQELIPSLVESSLMSVSGAKQDDPQALLLSYLKTHLKFSQKVHSVFSSWLKDYLNGAQGADVRDRQRTTFWANQLVCSTSPSNYFWTNPSAVQKCIRTKGESLRNGFKNWLEDANRGDNLVRIADEDAFKVGENLATTPGFVVFRNELIELIQYTPATQEAHAVPVVFVQPSINRYYILDLTPEKSLVRYLLNNGFTVFMVSWKNPTAEMRDITFDDYVFQGALKAVEVAGRICESRVHAVGFCIGGTILSALMAWLNRCLSQERSMPIEHWTVLATLIDYSEPGEIGAFINEHSIDDIEWLMQKDGYLDGKYMAMAFRMLKSDSLIWRYYAHNYLQGEKPPKSDFLYWNNESTRLPAAMASFYLRKFYLENKLIKEDAIELGGCPIDLRRIAQPLYAVGAEQDHICPWRGTFELCNLVQGPARYALAEEGHIAGVVNPPSVRSRKSFRASEVSGRVEPDEWLSSQGKQNGSWWVDWVKWLSERCGPKGSPPPMGSEEYPPMESAPGTYVLEK